MTAVQVQAPNGSHNGLKSSIKAKLNFYLDPQFGGHTSFNASTAGAFRRKFDEHEVAIHDVRALKNKEFNLQQHGFQFCKQAVPTESLQEASIKSKLYPRTVDLIKEITGASRVHIFEHSIRRASRDSIQAKIDSDPNYQDDNAPVTETGPARFAHIDFSSDGADQMLGELLPDEAAAARKGRWSVINVWRPLKPIRRDPLAVCDSSSVDDDDLIAMPMGVPPDKTWSIYYLRYAPSQAWYYLSHMQLDDAIVFKCFDSAEGKGRRVPHSSFVDPSGEHEATRESVELRCFVFYDE